MKLRRSTVVLAEDHALLREEVTRLMARSFKVLAAAEDGEALIEAATRLSPDVLVVDIRMPGLSGIEAVRRLSASGCTAAVVMLTSFEEPGLVEASRAAGATAFVLKKRMGQDLEMAIRSALAGEAFTSRF